MWIRLEANPYLNRLHQFLLRRVDLLELEEFLEFLYPQALLLGRVAACAVRDDARYGQRVAQDLPAVLRCEVTFRIPRDNS